jgi:hypothetical protein
MAKRKGKSKEREQLGKLVAMGRAPSSKRKHAGRK